MEAVTEKIAAPNSREPHTEDERLMSLALDLAAKGTGQVSPSPLVGCVIVGCAGDIVGEGYYLYDLRKHAEVIALEQAGERARGGTAYVTLEPHAHHGRTPPCTEALIAAGIARVVYAIDDPNPLVSGRGGEALRDAGIEVETGVLALGASRQNEAYLVNHTAQRPFVHLKLACSLDGKIASRKGISQWLTGSEARARVHELRHQSDAILVGANTVRIDDPLLTDRSGRPRRRPLLRVVMSHDPHRLVETKLARDAGDGPITIISQNENVEPSSLPEQLQTLVDDLTPGAVVTTLYEKGIRSVLIEGGPTIAASFLHAGLVDRVTILLAPILIGGESDTPRVVGGTGPLGSDVVLHDIQTARLGDDIEVTGYTRPLVSR